MTERKSPVPAAEAIAVDARGAGQLLGLGRSSILNLADSGELPRLHFGRAVRFAVSDVTALVERRRSAAGRPGSRTAQAGIYRLSPQDPEE